MADTKNKVRFGLSNVHIALATDEGYEAPVAIPGAVSLSCDPEGDSEKFYADNGAYYTISTNAGYTGELEMALIPDEVKIAIFGWKADKNGALVEVADAVPKPFALLYQVNGDAKNRHNVFYNVTAERPSDEASTTEDSASPSTEKLSVTMIPAEIGGEKVTKLSIEPSEANASVIASFYDEVYEPDYTSAA
ncbi:major tail protein [Raoultibacter timonensis]|uniref:major tail protein n=1 Tax=Raoultibacter timonensis TaxID=1907662 RepID=UPI0026DDB5C3|nr:major tail protein [Raoultibacter timonensis]